jgi:hypothetical protein
MFDPTDHVFKRTCQCIQSGIANFLFLQMHISLGSMVEPLNPRTWTRTPTSSRLKGLGLIVRCFFYFFSLFISTESIGFLPVCIIPQRRDELANVALARHGLLGASPVQPLITFEFKCLELYHQLRRRTPSFSIQAMVKVLCCLHNVCNFSLHNIIHSPIDIDQLSAVISRPILHRVRHISHYSSTTQTTTRPISW